MKLKAIIMMSSVPQFIDVEDKIVGPLTWKQLGWMIAMGVTVLILGAIFGTIPGIIIGIPVVLLFLALAFYKPNGFPMTTFIAHTAIFLFRPKVAVWERPIPTMMPVKSQAETPGEAVPANEEKQLNHDKLKELARIMDSQRR